MRAGQLLRRLGGWFRPNGSPRPGESHGSEAEELRRHVAQLRLVAAVADATASAPDEASLLARVTELVSDAFYPENCGFLLLDPRTAELRHDPSFHSQRGPERLGPIPLSKGIVGAVARSGEARRVDDTRLDPDYLERDPEMRSEICVPLRVGTSILGVFDAETTRLVAFTSDDEQLLRVVASHVASAVERFRAAAALRQSEELYRAYFTASPVALLVADAGGRYVEVNGAACALTGLPAESLRGRSIRDLLAPDAVAQGERLLGLLALGGGPSEIRIQRAEGSTRHCLVHATAIDPERLLVLMLDISGRRDAEERLRESEARFRSLSEASLEAIFIHDGGRIVDANQALCEMGGYSWHELVGRDGFELVAPEHREAAYRNLLVEFDQPQELDVVKRDGTRLPVEIQARSFVHNERVLRVVSVRDLSARNQAAAVRESLVRELEAKNAELERFGYTVSHDLKSPLVTVKGFAEHIERDVALGRLDRLPQDARRIAEAATRVQLMLDELLDLSRAGRPLGPPVAVSAEEVVRESLRLVADRLRSTGASVEIRPGLPVVYGDRARLVRVFQNLVDNAAKFGAAAGAPRVVVESRGAQEGRVTLVVRDNGIGIEPRHRERVFDPFQKLDPRSEGAGVGLAVVRRIVESHGGSVWVEAAGASSAGSAVCVTLPTPPAGERGLKLKARSAASAPTPEAARPAE